MEMNSKFHGEPPSEEEFHRALDELDARPEDHVFVPKPPPKRLFERGRRGTRDAFGDAVIEIMERDPNTWAIAADLAKSTRFDKVAKRFPERLINVGPQEQNMMGIAAGLAAEGNTVFASTFAVFGELAFERVRQQIAIPNLNVKMLLSHAGFSVGKDGKSAQSFEHIGVWRLLPNMHVIVPADYNEAKAAIRCAVQTEGPFVIFASRENFPQLYDEIQFEAGRARVHSIGHDATIIACGLMVHFALEAAHALENEGMNVGVINMASVTPLDERVLLEAARNSGGIVVAEEHSKIGGLCGAVCEFLSENHPVPVETVSINDTFGTSGDSDAVLEAYGLTPADIVSAVRRVHARKQKK
jgi:transketolase